MSETSSRVGLSVILPAFNEEGLLATTVEHVAESLARQPTPFEIVVVENGSTDRTWSVATELARRWPVVRPVRLGTADYGLALRTGLREARGSTAVLFDVDCVDMAFMEQALDRLRTTPSAIIVGSKRSADASDDRTVVRRLVTASFSRILRTAFGLRVSDTHGMKVLDLDEVGPLVDLCSCNGDLFDTELIIRAERQGLTVGELPVHVRELRPARTSIVRRAIRTVAGLVRLRIVLGRHGDRG